MVPDVPVVEALEAALVIHVVAITVLPPHRTVPLAIRAAAILASVTVPAPAALAPLVAIAPAVAAAEAVVVAPLAEARALVAVVDALADKRYVTPNLNPFKRISYEKVICNSCYRRGHYARSSTGNV